MRVRQALLLAASIVLPGLLMPFASQGQGGYRVVPLEWDAPPVELRLRPDGSAEIAAGDYEIDARPGALRLPFTSALIAIPPGTTPVLRVRSVETTTLPLPGPVTVVPRPEGIPLDPERFPLGSAPAPADPLPPPAGPVVLEELGVLRGVRLARVVFYPAIPNGNFLRVYRRVRAEVEFVPHPSPGGSAATPSPLLQRGRGEGAGGWGEGSGPHPSPGGSGGTPSPLLQRGRGEGAGGWGEGSGPHPSPGGFAATPSPLLTFGQERGGGRGWGEDILRRAVLNPQDVVPAFPARPSTPGLRPQGGGTPQAFLEVSRPGLYRVMYPDLQPLGFAGANPANFRLFRGTDEVAYEWSGDGDAVFEPGEAILFYAEPRFSRWTGADVYRLVADESPGLRMTSRSADPSGLPAGTPWVEQTFEENRLYMPDRFAPGIPLGRDGDRWAWDYLSGSANPITYTHPFSLTAVNAAHPATLTLWAIGYTSGEHRWDIRINGVSVGQLLWTGKTAITATLSVPSSVLQSTNALSVTVPVTSGAWLDAFALRFASGTASWGASVTFATSALPEEGPPPPSFPHRLYLPLIVRGSAPSPMRAYTVRLNPSTGYRAYDITDPLHPIRVLTLRVEGDRVTVPDPGDRPRRYLVLAEEAIRAPDRIRPQEDLWGFHAAGGASGADYLIITHPAFADTLGPLADLRRSQGLSVAVVNVLGIYDTYGDGRPDPEAIRRFIADAYATWNPRPAYVLLVGDGSYDPKRYRPQSPPTFIPPYLADVDPQAGETAADNRYVCVDGNDNLPDLLLGRLPVKTADEARAVIQKIVDYETRPLPGGWNASVVLVADDPDPAGNFPAHSDAAAAWVSAPFTVTRRYCWGTDPNRSDDCAEVPALRAALMGDWNQGAFLIQYFGHASWQQWMHERAFHLDDLPALHNTRRYPVLAEMTCLTGAFHRPEPTLDEALVTRPEAGAVAAWGPTGLSLATGHRRLSEGFFRAVFSDTVATLGEATLAGKLNLVGAPQGGDLLDTYVLLGDPALRWNRAIVPWSARLYLPLVVRK